MKNNLKIMKKPLTLLFFTLIFTFAANAKTYYVSNSGSDNNSGTSSSSPWRTVSKVSSFSGFLPGDAILFNRDDVFYGELIINNSGSSGNPITFGAYGTGADPVITGFTNVTSWNNLGGNIWESANAVSSLASTNMVSVNGANTPMGRYPNSGWLTYQSFSGRTSITSGSLSGSPNWTGADVVIRKQRWIIDRNKVTSQSGGTIYYTSASTYNGQNGYGFFIQNDSRTLDETNEWYFNPSTKKIRIYNTSTPSNVRVASIDTLVNVQYRNFIIFDNLSFQGSNKDAFTIMSSSNVTIQNCSIDYSGYDAVWGNKNGGQSSTNFVLKNTTINHTNNNGINLSNEFSSPLITNNIIKNTGMVVGMGGSGDGTSIAIQTHCNSAKIQYNLLDSTGYMGIQFFNNNTIVNNNFINHFCMVKLDGAGIYTWIGKTGIRYTGQKVLNNIVINGMGDNSGTTATGSPISHGIYIDDWAANVEVGGNSVAFCPYAGIYLHNSQNINIHNNTSYGNGTYQVLFASFDAGSPIRNDIVKNNVFVSVSSLVGSFETSVNDISQFGYLDSNYYARPLNDNLTIQNDTYNYTSFVQRSLPLWQTFSGQDAHSKRSPKSITTVNDIRFEYNPTTSSKTISLDGNYIDVKNESYNGSITLAPYTSAVLIRNGAATNLAPTANAGSDKTITLPTSTVTLSGSGTDQDGNIVSYNWSQVSGPAPSVITSPNSASTSVTSLIQGTYQFQLKVTDNAGASGTNTVQVTVNGLSNNLISLLPAVDPGPVTNGMNYNFYESGSGYSNIPDFSSLTPTETGTVSNFDLSQANSSTTYAFNFTGYIDIPADGQYTFYTTSDDGSKLYIDNVLVVNNDGLHSAIEKSGTIGLKAGKHAISLGYIQQGGTSTLNVDYSGPGTPKQMIPSTDLYVPIDLLPAVNPGPTVHGINYSYYESGSGYSAVPNFSGLNPKEKGTLTNIDLSPANRTITYAFNYTGYIYVPYNTQYTFYLTSDDGSNLYIDNVLVVNNDGLHGAIEQSGTIGLQQGLHAISIGYFQQGGGSTLIASYSSSIIPKQPLQSSTLFIPASGGSLSVDTRINQNISSTNQFSVKAYPNPFVNSITVNVNGDAGDYKLMMVDASGRVVWNKAGTKTQGSLQQSIDGSLLPKGIYFLRFIQKENTSVIKLEK